jgi:diacylglycerol O-acyltransferase
MSDIVYDRQMSDTEGLMWRLERDPLLSTTFANVSILDRAPDFDRLRRRMERSTLVVPRLRQVARESAASLAAPHWVDDPEFDIDAHLRRIALPAPGNERQLLDLATLITVDPFDRTRPLWHFTVVEGLADGRSALIEKLHHTISDGEGGVLLAMSFLDLDRDAPNPPPPPRAAEPDEDELEEHVSAAAARDLLAGTLRLPLGVARQVKELLAEPERIADANDAATSTLLNIVQQLGETEPAQSPLWTQRSTRRRLEVATAPLAVTRAIARKLGGTLNTAFLTIAAEAAGRYHTELGAPVDSLRASMAISTRPENSGANAFSVVRLHVPTGEMGLASRFAAVADATRAARADGASASLDKLAALASTLPAAIVTSVVRRHARTVDFATSNVKGSADPVYIAGARILHNYPVGPLGGVAFNLTLLSYEDRLDMGINTDAAAIERPDVLRDEIDSAIGRFASL